MTDIAGELAGYADSFDSDPGRLAQLQDAGRCYKVWCAGTPTPSTACGNGPRTPTIRMDEPAASQERLAELTAERDSNRSRVGPRPLWNSPRPEPLPQRSSLPPCPTEFADFALPNARIEVALHRRDGHRPVRPACLSTTETVARVIRRGSTRWRSLLVPHAGAPARALSKGASGGELSRVMLAVEVVFAGADHVQRLSSTRLMPGSGAALPARWVGDLPDWPAAHQVLVVTHLPQVAAFADRHLVVSKDDDGSVTASGVREVSARGTHRELAQDVVGPGQQRHRRRTRRGIARGGPA